MNGGCVFSSRPMVLKLQLRESATGRSSAPLACWLAPDPFNPRFVALPFSDTCPPLAADPALVPLLADRLTGLAAPRGGYELRGVALPAPWRVVDCFQEWTVDLGGQSRNSNAAALRISAARCGAPVRWPVGALRVDLEDLGGFYQLMMETRHRKGLPVQPLSFFKRAHELFSPAGDLEIWSVSQRGQVIASGLMLRAFDCLHYKWSARRTDSPSGAAHLLLWSVIERHAGVTGSLNLGRTDARNSGLVRFKKEAGAGPRQCPTAFIRPRPTRLAPRSSPGRCEFCRRPGIGSVARGARAERGDLQVHGMNKIVPRPQEATVPSCPVPLHAQNDAFSFWKLPEAWRPALKPSLVQSRIIAEWYLLERYQMGEVEDARIRMSLYYAIKNFIPVKARHLARSMLLRMRPHRGFPKWPCEDALLVFQRDWMLRAIETAGGRDCWHVGFWPNKGCCIVLTHDVESPAGFNRMEAMAELEDRFGFRSAWKLPLDQYPIDWNRVERLCAQGFEFGAHGLRHDGMLFRSHQHFLELAPRVERLARAHGLRGFRSPSTLRNANWLKDMDFDFDSSSPTPIPLSRSRAVRAPSFPTSSAVWSSCLIRCPRITRC